MGEVSHPESRNEGGGGGNSESSEEACVRVHVGLLEALLQMDAVEHGCAGAGAHNDPGERSLANVFPCL